MSWALHTHKELFPPLLSPPIVHGLSLLQINSFFFRDKSLMRQQVLYQRPLSCLSSVPGLLWPQPSEAGDEERTINFHMESKPLEGVDVFAWFTHPFIFPSSLSVPLEENGNGKGGKHTEELLRTSLNSHR